MVVHHTAASLLRSGDNARMRIDRLDVADPAVATEVLAVQQAAYRVEADLIGSSEIPPLQEGLDELMTAQLDWLGLAAAGVLVAAIAFTRDENVVDIDRLIVAPVAMRQGHGSALVEALGDDVTITVSTGTLNGPARQLYEKLGFAITGESEPVPGLRVTHYLRRPDES